MASLEVTLQEVETTIGRGLNPTEQTLATKMYRNGKDAEYIIGVLSTPEDPEPSDDQLVTTRYEATISGPQDITGIWG